MPSKVIVWIFIAAIGILIGLLIRQPDRPATMPTTMPTTMPANPASSDSSVLEQPVLEQPVPNDLASISQALQNEIAARAALEARLQALEQRLQATAGRDNIPLASTGSASNNIAADDPAATTAVIGLNEQALIDAGMSTAQAANLKLFYEQLEMEKLTLRDQAIREGWADTTRYGEALQAIDLKQGQLQDSLDENSYDAYLYATGQSNRVEISSVLASSPAASAGFLPGDQILRYDNQRIYSWRELRDATTQGSTSQTVLVELQRGDQRLQVYLPRGPLGIRMNSISVMP